MLGGRAHSLGCEHALSSPRVMLRSARGSLNSMGLCWAQTGSRVYTFLYYSPVLQEWCGHGTCHSLVFLTYSEALSTLANSYLISSGFVVVVWVFVLLLLFNFSLSLFLQAWFSLPNCSQHSRLMWRTVLPLRTDSGGREESTHRWRGARKVNLMSLTREGGL